MGKIHLLPTHIISQIAAGEVIERPAFVVKELLENAIDARATSITIHSEKSGLKRIIVSDNGEGMDKEDLLLAAKLHTTSKLNESDTLLGIKTCGFRGEALASIAAVSDLTIKSREKSSLSGMQVIVKNGREDVSPVGMPHGTTVIVENLFANLPARLKFLKSARTEVRHITDIVLWNAIAYPDIGFRLFHNKRLLFDLPPNDMNKRIRFLFGKNTFSSFVPVSYTDTFGTISGFIAKPHLTSLSQHKQYIFVNKRKVADRLISLSVKEAYGTLLESHAYPLFLLSLSLPYETVDVNVHPRKEHVQFINPNMVFDAVKQAVSETLRNNNLTLYALPFGTNLSQKSNTASFAATLLKRQVTPFTVREDTGSRVETIQQLHKLYLLVSTETGIVLIDQHAAHERILYEQFFLEFQKQKQKTKQYLLMRPILLDLSFSDSQLAQEHKKTLSQLGFRLKQKNPTQIIISAVPKLLYDRDPKELIQEILNNLESGKTAVIDTISQKMIAYLACRKAIKAGEVLNPSQAEKLVRQLQTTKNKYTCPHGRPAFLEIPLSSLHHFFQRQ